VPDRWCRRRDGEEATWGPPRRHNHAPYRGVDTAAGYSSAAHPWARAQSSAVGLVVMVAGVQRAYTAGAHPLARTHQCPSGWWARPARLGEDAARRLAQTTHGTFGHRSTCLRTASAANMHNTQESTETRLAEGVRLESITSPAPAPQTHPNTSQERPRARGHTHSHTHMNTTTPTLQTSPTHSPKADSHRHTGRQPPAYRQTATGIQADSHRHTGRHTVRQPPAYRQTHSPTHRVHGGGAGGPAPMFCTARSATRP
jgi:hypothetical protein